MSLMCTLGGMADKILCGRCIFLLQVIRFSYHFVFFSPTMPFSHFDSWIEHEIELQVLGRLRFCE